MADEIWTKGSNSEETERAFIQKAVQNAKMTNYFDNEELYIKSHCFCVIILTQVRDL